MITERLKGNCYCHRKKIDSKKRHEGLVIKPPANLVPFSDEWLMALETAGEVRLTSH